MGILKVVGFAVFTACTAVTIKQIRPDIGTQVSVAAGIVIMLYAIAWLSGLIDDMETMIKSSGINSEYVSLLIKTVGVAYVTQLASDSCRDCGEGAIASKVEMCGRIAIMAITLPFIAEILKMIGRLAGYAE